MYTRLQKRQNVRKINSRKITRWFRIEKNLIIEARDYNLKIGENIATAKRKNRANGKILKIRFGTSSNQLTNIKRREQILNGFQKAVKRNDILIRNATEYYFKHFEPFIIFSTHRKRYRRCRNDVNYLVAPQEKILKLFNKREHVLFNFSYPSLYNKWLRIKD